MIDRFKQYLKKQLITFPTDFDQQTLPWIDVAKADIPEFVNQYTFSENLPFDLQEKLSFWEKNGYVILENIIPENLIDFYMKDVDELIQHKDQYSTEIRIDLPEHVKNPVQPISAVPMDILMGRYVKINDFHNQSVYGKKLMLHSGIVGFLQAIFNQTPVAMQSLTFLYGSQQATHQDFPYVTSQISSHLAAAWIPLEDVHADAGPLYYFAGSHKIKKFKFGNGIFYNEHSKKNPDDFAIYLDKLCARKKLKKETLLIKKGDVLIWHASLVHGGDPIINPELTRKSFVCHYSSQEGYQWHRKALGQEPTRFKYNGGEVFDNPSLQGIENSFKAGESYQE